MSQQQRLIYLPLVGTILLCLLIGMYLAAWKRFSNSTPSNKVTKHAMRTPPDLAIKYWTTTSMHAATDADQLSSIAPDLAQGSIDTSVGKAAQQQGQPPRNGNISYPLSTIGKVFLTNAAGQNLACSGTAVVS